MECQKCKEREATCCHYLHWEEKPIKADHRLVAKSHPDWFIDICQTCHDEIHGIEARKGRMARVVKELIKTQKARISINNQIRSLGGNDFMIPDHLNQVVETCEKAEKDYEKQIKVLLEGGDWPIWDWLKGVKGISHKLAGKLIAYIDIFNTPKPSNLWQFCGYGDPEDKLRKGYKIRHNPDLKAFCYQIADSFVKQRTSPYRKVYDETKERELKRVKTKGHAHNRAMRKMIKAFLLDLYLEWRKSEGLPVSKPYAEAIIHGK